MPEEVTIEPTRNPRLSEKDNLTTEAQAILVNQRVFEKSHPLIEISNTDDASARDSKEYTNRGILNTLNNLDHAARFANNQPYDKDSVTQGINTAFVIANERVKNAKNEPDDANAAENDLVLLKNLNEKFLQTNHNANKS